MEIRAFNYNKRVYEPLTTVTFTLEKFEVDVNCDFYKTYAKN
jgi:hypothetical protein